MQALRQKLYYLLLVAAACFCLEERFNPNAMYLKNKCYIFLINRESIELSS